MLNHEKISYVEFPTNDLNKTKQFFTQVFNWKFKDFGDEYASSTTDDIEVGFFKADLCSNTQQGGALIVFYSDDLETTLTKVKDAGATVTKDIFSFPGGRRFQFIEPCGNELAIWSDK